MKSYRIIKRQEGFTIVELMIATTVLSVILLLSTVMITSIGNLYYKGVNEARLQDDVRNITDEVSQHLQLNANPVETATHNYGSITMSAYCIGATRYSYVVGTQIGTTPSTQIDHVLWRDTFAGTCIPVDLSLSNPESGANAGTNGTELMAPNSRLTFFSISPTSPYTIQIAVAYGITSLLNLNTTAPTSTCKGGSGDAFCATASLETTVVQRIT